MPGMSGYEVLERLKCDPRHGDIPVLMISALDEIDSAVRCIEAGAEDYLAKPFDPVLLRARVNACLEKKRLRDREKIILQQLRLEKDKTDALLLNILPEPIVARLQSRREHDRRPRRRRDDPVCRPRRLHAAVDAALGDQSSFTC